MKAVTPRLVGAELDLVIAKFALARAVYHILEEDLLATPCVREDRVRGNIVVVKARKDDLASVVSF